MREQEFRPWLENSRYDKKTIESIISSAKRIEAAIGDLDEQLDAGGYEKLSTQFLYSAEDERNERSNPSPISVDGNLRNELASLKKALRLYNRFRNNISSKDAHGKLVKKLTRTEIEAAMKECDDLGTDRFLGSYEFSRPNVWIEVAESGKAYPAKAIVAIAAGRISDDGKPLTAKKFFNGHGESQSRKKLEKLGYTLIKQSENDTNADIPSRPTMKTAASEQSKTATNLILYGPPRNRKDFCYGAGSGTALYWGRGRRSA